MSIIKQLSTQVGHMRCQLSFTPNGEAAKTCKVRATVRTSEPVEVPGWFGGRLVHDLSGYRLRKSPLPMLYNHGGNVIGEWNRLEIDGDGSLKASGVIKSVSDGDLAGELIKKLEAGLPFEASINFADEMEISEVQEGAVAECNGRVYAGPLTVCRLFHVREVSICPLGADPLTSTTIDTDITEPVHQFAAIVRPSMMLSSTASDADTSQWNQPPEPTPEPKPETEPAEAKAVDAGGVVEGEQGLSVAQLARWSKEYGEKLAVEWSLDGLSEQQAGARFNDHLKAELVKTQELVKQLSQRAHPQVDFIPSDDPRHQYDAKAKSFERMGMTPGEAAFAARHSTR